MIYGLTRLKNNTMEESQFIKSVLPAQDSFVALLDANDTSLAVPCEDHLGQLSLTKTLSHHRGSLRVQQQVQLTLARKGRQTTSTGSLQLSRNPKSITDSTDGSLSNMRIHSSSGQNGGVDFCSQLSLRENVRRPSRRIEVSPSPSPEISRGGLAYRTLHFSTCTLPAQRAPRGRLMEQWTGTDLSRHYAQSEVPRWRTRKHASAHTAASGWSRPQPQSGGLQPLPAASTSFHQSSPNCAPYLMEEVQSSPNRAPYLMEEVQSSPKWTPYLMEVQTSPNSAPYLMEEVQSSPNRAPYLMEEVQSSPNRAPYLMEEVQSSPNRAPYLMEVQKESTSVRRQVGYGSGAAPGSDDLAWLAQVRREGQGSWGQGSRPASLVSMEVDMGQKREAAEVQQTDAKEATAQKRVRKKPALTMERAVHLLTQDNEDSQISAAGFIQNQCFNSAEAKKMVFYLHGIPKLLRLLQSDSEEVQRVAAGALRNVIFESGENKMEVKDNEGVPAILHLLKTSCDVETRRQLTGLLWNLSSHDLLKEHLTMKALPVLTRQVLVPGSGLSEGENPKDELLADPDIFFNATGCLRNLSSAGPDGRKAMRECEDLIDSLVYYIRGTIADYKSDDMSTENCVCILHNLSYQIEAELPQKYANELYESRQQLAPKAKTPGCFGSRSVKITQLLEKQCPLLEEKGNPCGVEWLWSAITVRMYLSLIARCVRHLTQEAAVGALQNITAGNGVVSHAIANTIVQRENGLLQVRKILQEGERDVKRTAVSLLRNVSRYKELHSEIVRLLLPELVASLSSCSDAGSALPSEVMVSLCHILINVSQAEVQHVRAIVNHGALPKVINISAMDNGYGPTRAGQAACCLLHSLWSHTELRAAYRKAGYRKADFVNSRTTKAAS